MGVGKSQLKNCSSKVRKVGQKPTNYEGALSSWGYLINVRCVVNFRLGMGTLSFFRSTISAVIGLMTALTT